MTALPKKPDRILGDAPERSYAAKLARFEAFAEPELRRLFAGLELPRHGTALDLGCGTGRATGLLAAALGPDVLLIGIDLSLPHLRAARAHTATLVQCDAERLCFRGSAFDLIYSCNTIHHIGNRAAYYQTLARDLRDGGRLAIVTAGRIDSGGHQRCAKRGQQ